MRKKKNPLSLAEYSRMVRGEECPACHAALTGKLEHYEHPGGWRVKGYGPRQWLAAICRGCNKGESLWKLGVAGLKDRKYNQAARQIARRRAV